MTKRFLIKHGLFLKSANKLFTPNTHYATDSEAEQKELLEVFAEAVEEIKPVVKKEPAKEAEKTVDPTDDITLAKGVGGGTAKKLSEKGITTLSALRAAMTDESKAEEMKALLGSSYAKVLANFTEPTPEA